MNSHWKSTRLGATVLRLAAGLLMAAAASLGAPRVRNGGFEADGHTIKGVGYTWQGNAISDWLVGRAGFAARNPSGVAFFDNGRTTGGRMVGILQNRCRISQVVEGFAPDTTYRLDFQANGRASDPDTAGTHGVLEVRLNGTVLFGPSEIEAVDPQGTHRTPFRAYRVWFTTGGGTLELALSQTADAEGVSVLFDSISITPGTPPAGTPAVQVNRARPRKATDELTVADMRRAVWIWDGGADADPMTAPPGLCAFRSTIDIPELERVGEALLVSTADNSARWFVNGRECGTAAGFSQFWDMDIRPFLRPGTNTLTALVRNEGDEPNPAGLAALAVVTDPEGRRVALSATGDSWLSRRVPDPAAANPAAIDWGRARPAHIIGPPGMPPWGDVGFLIYQVPQDFPRFIVPGHERHMDLLRHLHHLHYRPAGPLATMWELWLSQSSLWQAVATDPDGEHMRTRWARALHTRRIDQEGYVSTHQHHGFGHGEGWPFPTSFQAGATAWQFAPETALAAVPRADPALWVTEGLESLSVDDRDGWHLKVVADDAVLTSPPFRADLGVVSFVRLQWRRPDFAPQDEGVLEWTTDQSPEFGSDRRLRFRPWQESPGWQYSHIPVYRAPQRDGIMTQLRLSFPEAKGKTFRLQGVALVVDTRHPINNPCYLQGCTEYLAWTRDLDFLRGEIGRMRRALAYALDEFSVREQGGVLVPWVGHDGTSGIGRDVRGRRVVHHGKGIGNNYWDLLPFGGRDAVASMYLADALRRMARLERQVAAHPEWGVDPAPPPLAPTALEQLRARMVTRFRSTFWNTETKRFGACRDLNGTLHDYGYTFVNAESIYYGLASADQARRILDWLTGTRTVRGDTSVGDDIYHFRFGPRASTRRNTEWYTFVWSRPEGIPWGGQVQDGGAVLGFAFHDLVARCRILGPDNAWERLRLLLDWYEDVRDAGGYREYYKVAGRGTLQGGGTAGGLGMDHEFFESILVPQVMLYGFLGLQAHIDALHLDPHLPADWPSLTVTGLRYQGSVLRLHAEHDLIRLTVEAGAGLDTGLTLPRAWRPAGRITMTPLGGNRHRAPIALPVGQAVEFVRNAGDR